MQGREVHDGQAIAGGHIIIMKPRSPFSILGVRIDPVTMQEALDRIGAFLDSGRQHHVVTVNPEFIMGARNNDPFRSVLNMAALAVPDGVGVRFAGLVQGRWLPERVTGIDLTLRIAELAVARRVSLMLYGAEHGVAKEAAKSLQARYPKLHIVGAENEENFLFHRRSDEESIARIRRRRPAVLLVALGSPKQDLWIAKHLHHMPSVRVAMGVGGTFDYLAGVVPRAPRFVRQVGLEWLWRLAREKPALRRRRFHRILTATVLFPFAVLRSPRS